MAVADFNNASVGQDVVHPDGDRNAIGLPRDSVDTLDRIATGVQWSTAEITGLVAFDRNDIACLSVDALKPPAEFACIRPDKYARRRDVSGGDEASAQALRKRNRALLVTDHLDESTSGQQQ